MNNKFDVTKGIYFYCYPQGPADKAGYQHGIISLAEGLKQLGIPFYSDRDYWKDKPQDLGHLFSYNPDVLPDDCAVVILNDAWVGYGFRIPKGLFKKNRKYITVYIDQADGVITDSWKSGFRNFDIILKAHYNRKTRYPSNVYPWPFGLTNRIIKATEDIPDFDKRRHVILINFRITHSLRDLIRKDFLPLIRNYLQEDSTIENYSDIPRDEYDRLHWFQTGRRHYPSYYRRLACSVACACFGGEMFFLLCPLIINKIMRGLPFMRGNKIVQYDTWRFWESLAAGCVTFHVDFEKYGIYMPVMPENFKHYIGIDLDNMHVAIKRIKEEPDLLKNISLAGREWALSNYGPKVVAQRFLKLVNGNA